MFGTREAGAEDDAKVLNVEEAALRQRERGVRA